MGNTNTKKSPPRNKMGMMAAPVGEVDSEVVEAPVGVEVPVGDSGAPVGAPTMLGPVYPTEISMPEANPPSAFQPSNCQLYWKQTFADMGSLGHYPRPQGNLPMFNWGLTKEAQENLGTYYKSVIN